MGRKLGTGTWEKTAGRGWRKELEKWRGKVALAGSDVMQASLVMKGGGGRNYEVRGKGGRMR